MTTAKKKPVHTIRRSGRVTVSIWERADATGKVNHSLTVERRYQIDNQWKSSSSFFPKDVAGLIDALEEADQWLALREDELQAD